MKIKLFSLILLSLGLVFALSGCSSETKESSSKDKVETTVAAKDADSEYCQYVQDFRDASEQGKKESGEELVGVPGFVRDQLAAVEGMISETSGDEAAEWTKYKAYLDAYIAAIEEDKIDDDATNENLGKLVQDAFGALYEVAQPVNNKCGFALGPEFEGL